MLITYFGIILFEISEWVKFIKTRSPAKQAWSLQVTGREVVYTCLRQRHEVSIRTLPAIVALNNSKNLKIALAGLV